MGRVIALANQKGGVGKTTTSVNLGASLAVAERRTLLVDMDPQAQTTSGLGLSPGAKGSIYEVVLGRADMAAVTCSLGGELEHLDVVPSSRDLAAVNVELVDRDGRERALREALSTVKERYDYILVDCPPSLELLTIVALVAADAVIVPLQCEYYALEGLSELLQTIERIREAFNPALAIDGILLTMSDPRNNLSRQVEDEVRRHFGQLVFETVIPRNVRLSESPSFGKPVLLHDIRSKGSQAYLHLAREVLEAQS